MRGHPSLMRSCLDHGLCLGNEDGFPWTCGARELAVLDEPIRASQVPFFQLGRKLRWNLGIATRVIVSLCLRSGLFFPLAFLPDSQNKHKKKLDELQTSFSPVPNGYRCDKNCAKIVYKAPLQLHC